MNLRQVRPCAPNHKVRGKLFIFSEVYPFEAHEAQERKITPFPSMLTTTERKLLTLALDPVALEAEADLAATRFARSLRQRGLPIIGGRKSWAVSSANAAMRNYVSVTKEVVGIRVRLTRSLFDDGIPRKWPLRVWLAKATSAVLRF